MKYPQNFNDCMSVQQKIDFLKGTLLVGLRFLKEPLSQRVKASIRKTNRHLRNKIKELGR